MREKPEMLQHQIKAKPHGEEEWHMVKLFSRQWGLDRHSSAELENASQGLTWDHIHIHVAFSWDGNLLGYKCEVYGGRPPVKILWGKVLQLSAFGELSIWVYQISIWQTSVSLLIREWNMLSIMYCYKLVKGLLEYLTLTHANELIPPEVLGSSHSNVMTGALSFLNDRSLACPQNAWHYSGVPKMLLT